MDAHPGIVFRPGPAGRRAAVAGGPDVWEVIRVVRNVEAPKKRVVVAADWLSLSEAQVRAAIDYYAAFQEEIEDWIARVDEAAAREQEREERHREALA